MRRGRKKNACVCVCAQVKYALLHVVAFVKLCISRACERTAARQTKQRPFLARENQEQGFGGGRGVAAGGSPSVPSKQGAALGVFGAEPASDTGRLVRP